MGQCKDCVFWDEPRINHVAIAGTHHTGICSLLSRGQIVICDGYMCGSEPALPKSFEGVVPLARIDGLSFGAAHNKLTTHPEFGCIQFKHKRLTVLT